jgi:hypothetical protein
MAQQRARFLAVLEERALPRIDSAHIVTTISDSNLKHSRSLFC